MGRVGLRKTIAGLTIAAVCAVAAVAAPGKLIGHVVQAMLAATGGIGKHIPERIPAGLTAYPDVAAQLRAQIGHTKPVGTEQRCGRHLGAP